MRPSLTGPMIAVRSSGTAIFPVAEMTPAIGAAETVSVSIALSADWITAGLACAFTGAAEGVVDRLQPPPSAAMAAIKIRNVLRPDICEVLSPPTTFAAALRLRVPGRAVTTGSQKAPGKKRRACHGACGRHRANQESNFRRLSTSTQSGFECHSLS